jgi:hypothetical protein
MNKFEKACNSAKGSFRFKGNLMECQVNHKQSRKGQPELYARSDSALTSACYFKSTKSITPNGAKIIKCDKSMTPDGAKISPHQIQPYIECITVGGKVGWNENTYGDGIGGLQCLKFSGKKISEVVNF